MSNPPRFLDSAGELSSPEETHAFYAGWARTYEQEVREHGYVTPVRCAEALLACGANLAAPLLDLGCGTGLSGAAFREAGFHVIDGSDFCEEMLAVARGKAGVYRRLVSGDLAYPIPAAPGEYASIAAVGVFGPGHAPPETIDEVLARLAPGGLFAFSLTDRALADPAYQARVAAACDAGTAQALFSKHGPHLPGKGLRATVVVLRRV